MSFSGRTLLRGVSWLNVEPQQLIYCPKITGQQKGVYKIAEYLTSGAETASYNN